MTDQTPSKLLLIIEYTIDHPSDNSRVMAQKVIDAMADWFEDSLSQIGMPPVVIPTLLRWQAHQHEYDAG